MMIIIIILTASYIGDDVRIVYSLANTMRSFLVTDGQGDSRRRIYVCTDIIQREHRLYYNGSHVLLAMYHFTKKEVMFGAILVKFSASIDRGN